MRRKLLIALICGLSIPAFGMGIFSTSPDFPPLGGFGSLPGQSTFRDSLRVIISDH